MTRFSTLFLAALCGFVSNSAMAQTAPVDADGDGFTVPASGGNAVDCDDGDNTIFPTNADVLKDCDATNDAGATCPTGQHAVTSTKCEPDAPTVDAEAKACADLGGNTLRFYTSVHAECVAAGANCTWYGATETDEAKRCHGIEADGFTWLAGKVVPIGVAADARAQAARAAAARATAQVGALRQDLREEAAARIAAIEALQAEVDQIADELEDKATKADVAALEARQTAAQRKLEELTLRIGGPEGLEAIDAQLQENDRRIIARLTALEGTVAGHTVAINELGKRGVVYVRVEARATIAGQTAVEHKFTDYDADGDEVGDFTRLARGSVFAGGGVNFSLGGDFGRGRVGLTIQLDVGAEQGDEPNGNRKWFTAIVPALGIEALADIGSNLSIGGAVGYVYHATEPSSLGGSRVSGNGVRIQSVLNWRPTGPLSLTVTPFLDAGNCGGVGYGEKDEMVVAQGTCVGGGLSVGVGAAF